MLLNHLLLWARSTSTALFLHCSTYSEGCHWTSRILW
jgi:hypothetical protein